VRLLQMFMAHYHIAFLSFFVFLFLFRGLSEFNNATSATTVTHMTCYTNFCLKFRFLFKISIFVQNFNFCPKFRFLFKISIFVQNFYFCSKFRFLFKISISVQNFDFCSKFRFLFKISIFVQNFDFFFHF